MPARTPDSQASRPTSPRRSPAPEKERFIDTLARRTRDLLIMGVVGPAMGVAALFAIHEMSQLHPAPMSLEAMRAARESERALAALEDRPMAAPANVPQPEIAASAAPAPAATAAATGDAPVTTASLDPDIASLMPAPLPDVLPEIAVADFGAMTPSPAAREMADWIVTRHDNGRMPFVVLDKHNATLYVFQPDGTALESTNVLLGQSRGDETFPGIGDVPISQVKPFQRTTAAGRFVTRPGLDEDKTDVVWLDYDAALAMHRVINKVKSEHRLTRIVSPDPNVRRISWGCINIPIDFFDRRISPVFGKHAGVAYVIPETKTFAEVFEQNKGVPMQMPVMASASTHPAHASMAPRDIAAR